MTAVGSTIAALVHEAVQGAVKAGASRQVAAAVAAASIRTAASILGIGRDLPRLDDADGDDDDPAFQERANVFLHSLWVHREDCKQLGLNVHRACDAAAMAYVN